MRTTADGNWAIDSSGINRETVGHIKTQIYDISKNGQPRLVKGVELEAKPIISGNYTSIGFSLDGTNLISHLGTISATNQNGILYGINERAIRIPLRVHIINPGGNYNSPEIRSIKIY